MLLTIKLFTHAKDLFKIARRILVYNPDGNTPQDTNCTATCLLSRKLFKLDEPDMQ